MKFIVTGATGFIGSAFTKILLEYGHEVYAVCLEHSSALKRLPKDPSLKLVYSTLEEYCNLPSQIESADIFVNFAWYGNSVESRSINDIQQKNVSYIAVALKSAQKMGCKLFVEPGTQAEYGTVLDKITEETPCHPFSEYGKAKATVKDVCFNLCEKIGIKYMHLRIFSVYGEFDHLHTLILTSLNRMLENDPLDLSSCTQNWNFIYVRDVAKQIYFLCEKAYKDENFQHEVFNLASEDTRPLRNFVERIKYLLNSSSVLNFGMLTPEHLVTLNPDISKMKNYIGNKLGCKEQVWIIRLNINQPTFYLIINLLKIFKIDIRITFDNENYAYIPKENYSELQKDDLNIIEQIAKVHLIQRG